MSALSAPHFHDEEAAYAYVEARICPNCPNCPHCGGVDRIGKMGGKSTRVGTYKCYQCRKPFTVKIGTIFKASHVPMRIWLQAMYLIAGSKKGISSNQLHRTLGVTLKTAWFMSHRIREAMRDGNLALLGTTGASKSMKPTSDITPASLRSPVRVVRLTSCASCRWLTVTAARLGRCPLIRLSVTRLRRLCVLTSPRKPS